MSPEESPSTYATHDRRQKLCVGHPGLWCGCRMEGTKRGSGVVLCPPEEGLQQTTSLCICASSAATGVWRLQTSGSHTRHSSCDTRLGGWLAGYGEKWPRDVRMPNAQL